MSRGRGRVRTAIWEALTENDRFIGEVRWEVARKLNRVVTREQRPCIDPNFYKSFQRAVAAESQLRSSHRVLSGLDEFVHLYPFQTLDESVVLMRQLFLPSIRPFILNASPGLPFNLSDNELFLMRRLRDSGRARSETARAEIEARWLSLETRLLDQSNRPLTENLLALVARGRQLFCNSVLVECRSSFFELLNEWKRVIAGDSSTISLADDIDTFFESVLSRSSRRHARLRSILYTVMIAGDKHTTSRVKEPFKEYLRRQHPADMKQYILGENRLAGHLMNHVFDFRLNLLVQRDAFGRFEFLRRVAP